MSTDAPPFLAYPIKKAAELIGVSRAKLYELIRAGELEKIKIGGTSLIPHESLQLLIDRRRPGGDLPPRVPPKRR